MTEFEKIYRMHRLEYEHRLIILAVTDQGIAYSLDGFDYVFDGQEGEFETLSQAEDEAKRQIDKILDT